MMLLLHTLFSDVPADCAFNVLVMLCKGKYQPITVTAGCKNTILLCLTLSNNGLTSNEAGSTWWGHLKFLGCQDYKTISESEYLAGNM